MKSIKNIALTALLTIGAFGAVTLTSCSKDDDSCATGYEGTDCKTLSRDKFIGTYVGSETCTVGSDNYTMTIAANSDEIKLTLTNLYNDNYTAIGTMTGTNTFSFSGSQSGTTFTGTGSLSGNQLTVSYTLSDGTISNTCTFIGSK